MKCNLAAKHFDDEKSILQCHGESGVGFGGEITMERMGRWNIWFSWRKITMEWLELVEEMVLVGKYDRVKGLV